MTTFHELLLLTKVKEYGNFLMIMMMMVVIYHLFNDFSNFILHPDHLPTHFLSFSSQTTSYAQVFSSSHFLWSWLGYLSSFFFWWSPKWWRGVSSKMTLIALFLTHSWDAIEEADMIVIVIIKIIYSSELFCRLASSTLVINK